MANCRDCKHAIFDDVWGEYKCAEHEQVIYDLDEYSGCKVYEKGEPKESKENRDTYRG